jgi:hypothetical protein
MNRLRQRGGVRISFFSFQDIITSVTGILILVTLMLSFSLRLDAEPEERRVENQLRAQRDRLAEIERENAAMQRRRIEATTLPNSAQAQARIEALQREEAQLKERRERTEEALRALREEGAELEKSAKLRVEVSELERRVQELRDKIEKEKTNSNRLVIIPDEETQRSVKRAVAMVVSGDSLRAERINVGDARDFAITSRESLLPILRRFDPAKEFVVFYFRPSGAKWFDAFRDEARRAGFEVGYDAVEEQKEIVFSSP